MQGTRLGPYQIHEQLGAGGMGEVWLGEDTRLGRKVAIKVLPEAFASDPERLARFEQEARAAAALNHPHIAAVFDVGVEGDVHYMVQELLEGRSLREVLDAGPMDLDRVRTIGGEVASALGAAHAAGVVHRDLKPENVFVTSAGYAKVLDFGLAKLLEPGGAAANLANSPTILGTQVGVIMGTAGYMAPEQVTGGEIDHRADLFALGCLLYEMALDQRAFPGENVHDVLNRVLTSRPDFVAARSLPARFRWLLDKATARDPARRYQTAADLAIDLAASLDESIEASGPVAPLPGLAAPAGRRRLTPLIAAAALVAGLVAGALLVSPFLAPYFTAAPEPQPVARFSVEIQGGLTGSYNRTLTLSPDGRRIVANTEEGLWIHDLTTGEGRLFAPDSLDRIPFFSPDGSSIGYWGAGQFWRTDPGRGTASVIGATGERPFGVHWAPDGQVYFGRAGEGVWRLPATGGEAEQVVELEPGLNAHGPELLPGGEWVMFTLSRGITGWRNADIVAQSLITDERRTLVTHGREARYVPGGYLVWVRGQTLMADTFDLDAMTAGGRPSSLEVGVRTAFKEYTGAADYAFSRNGVLAFAPPGGQQPEAFAIHREGRDPEPVALERRQYGAMRTGPGGRRIAAQVVDGDSSRIVLFDLARGSQLQISTGSVDTNPVWSHDGSWIYYASLDEGSFGLRRRRVDLSAPPETLRTTPADEIPVAVSPDGRWLYYETRSGANSDIARLEIEDPGTFEVLVSGPADEAGTTASPDGRYIVFQSDVGGAWGIHVLDLETGARHSIAAGYQPAWSPTGERIFFMNPTGIEVVDVSTTPEFSSSAPRRLAVDLGGVTVYDIMPDGEGVLGPLRDDPELGGDWVQNSRINVVVGWLQELAGIFGER